MQKKLPLIMEVLIEKEAGFCFGVVSAIDTCEKSLEKFGEIYCLGELVHNSMEINRLEKLGLRIIEVKDLEGLKDCRVMIRAHGEPPTTYQVAKRNNIEIIDATCPIVLKLQKDIKKAYDSMDKANSQIVIFGKKGHAEVIGLQGQTENTAIVISKQEEIDKIDFTKAVYLFSQTTKNKEEFEELVSIIGGKMKENNNENFFPTNSICKRMASRTKTLLDFADSVDAVLFVSGKHSSNGTYLYEFCKQHKEATYFISDKGDIDLEEIKKYNKIGISGATSTPMWLMEEIRDYVLGSFEDK